MSYFLLISLVFIVAAIPSAREFLTEHRDRLRRQRAVPHFESGCNYQRSGEKNQAIAAFTKAIDIDPTFESAFVSRGNLYHYIGDFDRAIADFTQAMMVHPKIISQFVLSNRAASYEGKGDFDGAIADYTRMINDSTAPVPYFEFGWPVTAKRRALVSYTKARNRAAAANAYFHRGRAHAGKADYDRAIADYTKAIELVAEFAKVYRARGAAYEHQGQSVLAQADYKMAADIEARQN